jgi:hypothetical protein
VFSSYVKNYFPFPSRVWKLTAYFVRYNCFKLLLPSLLQFKFALVLVGRPQFINEESEFFINLQDFKNPNQGMVEDVTC